MTTEEAQEALDRLTERAIAGEDVERETRALMARWLAAVAALLAVSVSKAWADGASIVPGPLTVAHQQSADAFLASSVERLRQAADVSVRRVADIQRQVTLARNISDVSYRTVARNLRKQLEESGATAFYDRLGRKYNLKAYTEMLVRTTNQQAANNARALRLAESGYDLVKITGPVPGERPACAHYAGRIVSLTGRTPGYPTLSDYTSQGGFGPNCRHSIAAAL